MTNTKWEDKWGFHPATTGRFPAFTIEVVDRKEFEGPGNVSSTDYRLVVSDGAVSIEIETTNRRGLELFDFRGQTYACQIFDEDQGVGYNVYPVIVGPGGRWWDIREHASVYAHALTDLLLHPEPDEPRLAYADVIQAIDPDRAELIRVQVELARSRRKGLPSFARADGYTRERILLDKHKERWSKNASEVKGVVFLSFLRGFVEHVRMNAREFLRNAERLYSCAPILHLDLVELKPHAREVFSSPLLDRIRSLRLTRNDLGDEEAQLLAASAHLGRLRWLDLSHNRVGQAGLDAITGSPGLPSLHYFDFAGNAAPDPTPKIGETDMDTNDVVSIEIAPAARALEARFGTRRWLSPVLIGTLFPPERDQV
jgi:uncharacterized protein (TIGR02996 family)